MLKDPCHTNLNPCCLCAEDEQTDNTPQRKDTSLEEGGKSETAKLADEKDVPPASTSASDPVEKPEMDAGGKAAGKDSISAEKMDTTDVGSSRPQTTVETVNPANTSDLDAAAATLDSQVSGEKVNSEIPAVLKPPPEPVDIKIIYNKKKYDHSTDLNNTILDLKREIEKLTGKVRLGFFYSNRLLVLTCMYIGVYVKKNFLSSVIID